MAYLALSSQALLGQNGTHWMACEQQACFAQIEELEQSKMEAPTDALSQEGAPGSMESRHQCLLVGPEY